MTREEKIKKGMFLFENLNSDITKTAQSILSELKPDSSLNEDKIINILLEYYNRGATQTKFVFPCPMCHDSTSNCPACNELMEELENYKK